MVKRYVAEPGSELVRDAMQDAEAWTSCRIGFVETVRAVAIASGAAVAERVRDEWTRFDVIELDQRLCEQAADLSLEHRLRAPDALHLASALVVSAAEPMVATWDRRLHAAALAEGLPTLPESLEQDDEFRPR